MKTTSLMLQYVIVGILLAGAVAFSVARLVRRAKGDSDCGCGCGKNCKNKRG